MPARSSGLEAKEKLLRLWFYLSQILSIIGLAGILDDLNSWIRFAEWAMAGLYKIIPDLSELLLRVGHIIREVTALWRSIFHPIIDLLIGWLPFKVPVVAKDILLIGIFVGFGWYRADNMFSAVYRRQKDRIRELAKEQGMLSPDSFYFGFDDFKRYVKERGADRSTWPQYKQDALKKLEGDNAAKALRFAEVVVNDSTINALEAEMHRTLFFLEPLLKRVVIVGASIVILFILMDIFME